MSSFVDRPTRYLFFTGKGGVGKTALACATAIHLADAGKRILLVSTDPASNLDEMLGVQLGHHATPVPGVDRLSALNIDPEKAADEYRERVIGPYRAIWTDAQIAKLREQLAGACTTEIAAFAEFAEVLAGDEEAVPYDHVLFDTVPTGHTLRLLTLPRAWTSFLESTSEGASCLGPHSGLKMQQARFSAALDALSDRARTIIVLVTRPDRAALREVDRTGHTLLLLDATGSYHRQIAGSASQDGSVRLVTPLMKLRDPAYTKMVLVTLAETTPVSEAARLQADLRRAEIEPFAWVVNASLAAAGSSDPLPSAADRRGDRANRDGARPPRAQGRDRAMGTRGARRAGAPPGAHGAQPAVSSGREIARLRATARYLKSLSLRRPKSLHGGGGQAYSGSGNTETCSMFGRVTSFFAYSHWSR
jgi:TRC40/GET3/ArsA family transport-energizing ATPase